jgi:hypothetical protein
MLLMPKASIMTEKLARRGLHIHQDYEADVMHRVRVSKPWIEMFPVCPDMTVGELADASPAAIRRSVNIRAVILDPESKPIGVITRGDIACTRSRSIGRNEVADAGNASLLPILTRSLHEASAKMLRNATVGCPSWTAAIPGRVVGYLGRLRHYGSALAPSGRGMFANPGWFTHFKDATSAFVDNHQSAEDSVPVADVLLQPSS